MIKKFLLITLFISFSLNAYAISLKEALSTAYKNNPEINAERENLKISEEELKISKSGYKPTLTISGSKSKENTKELTNQSGGDASITDVDPLTTSITIEQKIIDFGRDADYQKNIIGIDLAKAKFKKKEQDIFFKAVEAYTGLVLANEKYKINLENVNLLERQVETDRIRLDRGEITVSDVAQSESSLAGAKANLIIAESEVVTNKLNFENVIGPLTDLNSLSSDLAISINLPNSLNNALEVSRKNNPDLIISKLEYEQSEKDIKIAKSDLSPSASISFEKSYSEDLSTTYDEREKDILKATVTWPFYSGGKNRAKLNKNKNLKTQKRLLLDSALKTNEAVVASAWSNFLSNQSLLESVNAQVKAAEIANEGITAEYESGIGRTTLDVIQSNSLLLSALITRAESERNFILSQFNLLKSIGLLNSSYLKII
jgi:outer membrane protein|tara:strand:+ start:1220 stop:2515 length:1296 start_codon:yes stop_codon:yes gene_type:complete